MATATLKYPWGAATTETMSATGTQAITINNNKTVIDGVTTQATGNRTIDLTINSEIIAGAELIITNKTAATETLTHGTLITAPVIIGTAGGTTTQSYEYDGAVFRPSGEAEDAVGSQATTSAMTATGAQAITIANQRTIIDGVTTEATASRTINLTIGASIVAGATILVINQTNAAETLVFGTGITAPTLEGVAGKEWSQSFTYDGTVYRPDGTSVIEDAQYGGAATFEMTATSTQAVTIDNQVTIIDGATVEATANRTVNLTIDATVVPGATLLITNQTNGTETLTHGTGITAPVITGSAGKNTTQAFMYDGTVFFPAGAKIQID